MVEKQKDSSVPASLWRYFYTKRQLLFVLILLAISCYGIIDSFHDIRGQRFFGALPIVLPGVLAIWQLLSILKLDTDDLTTPVVVKWVSFTAALGALPFIAINILFTYVAWLIPANRLLIGAANYHSYWEGSIGAQLLKTGVIGFVAQIIGSILATVIILLPVLAKRKPEAVIEGTIFSEMKDKQQQKKFTLSMFTGFALFMVGFIVEISTLGYFLNNKPYQIIRLFQQILVEAQWIVQELLYGNFDPRQFIWLLGIVFIMIGILSVIWDLIHMQIVKMKQQNGYDSRERRGE